MWESMLQEAMLIDIKQIQTGTGTLGESPKALQSVLTHGGS